MPAPAVRPQGLEPCAQRPAPCAQRREPCAPGKKPRRRCLRAPQPGRKASPSVPGSPAAGAPDPRPRGRKPRRRCQRAPASGQKTLPSMPGSIAAGALQPRPRGRSRQRQCQAAPTPEQNVLAPTPGALRAGRRCPASMRRLGDRSGGLDGTIAALAGAAVRRASPWTGATAARVASPVRISRSADRDNSYRGGHAVYPGVVAADGFRSPRPSP